MARFIIYRWHDSGEKGFVRMKPSDPPNTRAIEEAQAARKDFGRKTGITWQAHEGDLVSAMIASAKI